MSKQEGNDGKGEERERERVIVDENDPNLIYTFEIIKELKKKLGIVY